MKCKSWIFLIATFLGFFSNGQDKDYKQFSIDSLFALSSQNLNKKNFFDANVILEILVNRKDELDEAKIPFVYNNLGVAKFGMGQYSEGIKNYKIAIEQFRSQKNDTLAAQVKLNLGLVYKEMGADSLASVMIYRAVYEFRKLKLKKQEVSALSSLGNLYRDGRQFERSAYFLNQSLKLSKEIEYPKGEALALHGFGMLMMEQEMFEKSKAYFKRSLVLKDSLNLDGYVATTSAKLGELFLQLDSCVQARFYLDKSIAIRSKPGSTKGVRIALNYFHLGQLEQKCGTLAKSEGFYLKAITLLKSDNALKDLMKAYEALLEIFQVQDRSKEALKISIELSSLKEQILGENNQKEIARLAIEYDVIGHENAVLLKGIENSHLQYRNKLFVVISIGLLLLLGFIFFLFRKNVLRKRKIETQNRMLQGKNRDIITLHDELSHRTNNFFTLLQGMLRIDLGNEHVDKNELLEMYGTRIQAMAEVQKHLILGTDSSMIQIDFKSYLTRFIEHCEILYASRNLKSISHNVESLKLNSTRYEIPTRVGIILNEMINNSVKHNRKIEVGIHTNINFEYQSGLLTISFSDNGSLDQSTNPSTGSGLELIKQLLIPINGKVEYSFERSFEARVIIPIKKMDDQIDHPSF